MQEPSDTELAQEARRQLAAIAGEPDQENLDLLRAALLVAAEEYPHLDQSAHVATINQFADRLRDVGVMLLPPARQIDALNHLFFVEEGFQGNLDDYYDPRNSYLNEVLQRRVGIPITLSVLYAEVGRRAGMPLHGVGLPGHFIVSYDGDDGTRILIDPFGQGRLLNVDDCRALISTALGPQVELLAQHLNVTPPRVTLARMISNLKVAYLRREDFPRALRSSEQLSLVMPSAPELRDRGLLRFRCGDLGGASADLTRYLEYAPDAQDAEQVRSQLRLIEDLRARRN